MTKTATVEKIQPPAEQNPDGTALTENQRRVRRILADRKGGTVTVGETTGPIGEARARVVALAQRERDFYRRVLEAKKELSKAEQAGDFQTAVTLRAEISYLESGTAGRDERRQAIVELHRLQADDMQTVAAKLLSEAAAKRLRTDETLAALKDHEGVDFVPQYQSDQMTSQQMEAEALSLQQNAQQLLRGAIKEEATISGMSGDELVDELLSRPEIFGPSLARIYERTSDRKFKSQTAGQRLKLYFTRAGNATFDLNGDGVVIGDRGR